MTPTDIAPLAADDFRTRAVAERTVTADEWSAAAGLCTDGRLSLLSLWGAADGVRMAVLDEARKRIGVLRLATPDGRFPSVGRVHAPAQRLERAVQDLFGLVADGVPDTRPWLDHGRWDVSHPMGDAGPAVPQAPYAFLPVEGESLHQVPVGPVHAGIIEPGHFRFTAQGETVVRLEARFGYVHKGIDKLMQGAALARGAMIAGRTSGDSSVAYAWAFAQAAEAALGIDVPARALWLRALMAELERLANHLGDFGAVCNDAAFALMLAHCGVLREQVLRAAHACFGHRFMRDRIVPGGVACDLDDAGIATLRGLIAEIGARVPPLVELYDNKASLLDRTVSTGWTDPELVRRFAAGGYVGRASGRDFDTRRDLAYAPYGDLSFKVPVRDDADVNARVWIRIHEIAESLSLIEQCLAKLPAGSVSVEVRAAGEPRRGLGLVESFRGDVLVWLALDADGTVARCHLRDPSWFQWPLIEAAIEGNIIADFPLINKSFNCSYSGHDL